MSQSPVVVRITVLPCSPSPEDVAEPGTEPLVDSRRPFSTLFVDKLGARTGFDGNMSGLRLHAELIDS